MSFINKSVNYSQANLLKGGLVKDLLTSYNKFYLSQSTNNCCLGKTSFIIPNNSKKFYLLISHNSRIEKPENYNLLYFFTDSQTNKILEQNKLEKNVLTDFFMEIDGVFKKEYLLEGYLYTATNSSNISNFHFLITDILFVNGEIVNCDYSLRYALINEHFLPLMKKMNRLNDHLTISIHPVFEESKSSSIVKLFLNNFYFASQVNSFEVVKSFHKTRKSIIQKDSTEEKLITKTAQSDVYNVTNNSTNNNEGILYVKSIKISKQLKELLFQKETIKIQCKFNIQFNKWEPLI